MNNELKSQCSNFNIGVLGNSNILKDRDLDRGGLHLNDKSVLISYLIIF